MQIAVIAASAGAVGGLAALIAREPTKKQTTEIRNRLPFPRVMRFIKSGRRSSLDLGLLGPMILGAVAALLLVFAIGAQPVSGEEAAQSIQEAPNPEAAVADALTAQISLSRLLVIALAAGIGAPLIVRGVASSPGRLIGDAAVAAAGSAQKEVRDAAKEANVGAATANSLAKAAARGATDGALSAAEVEVEAPQKRKAKDEVE